MFNEFDVEHLSKVNCVRYNGDSSLLVSASDDNAVKLWDTRAKANSSVQTLSDAADSVTCLDLSEFEILATSLDKSCRLYDIRLGQLITDYIGDELTFCKFGGDSQLLLLVGLNSPIRLFDRMSGELFNEYPNCSSSKYKLECCFALDDKIIISGSENGSLFKWNLIDASLVQNEFLSQVSIKHSP